MNATAKRRRKQQARATSAAEIAKLTAARDSLLDIINAMLTAQGGTVVVPMALVIASKRRTIAVEVKPPDPELAGSEARYVISFDDADKQDAPSAIVRPESGLWLPGQ